ncbi:MAG: PKD domain-containing protein [Candidatus Eisenbacteria bacterium]|uniref:PKD domain-containing protein n=1 Tax=Eiseniibacteriota bacterium TaxID=2212470 RepID=A0A538SU87_UNCEI|nr:MAG: PKD domain-containing protein [Candidatus Eisenbacteria bacterium]
MNCIVSPNATPSRAPTIRRRLAPVKLHALVAAVVASLTGWCLPAAAATYYVDRGNPSCVNSGAGAGTAAQPYCTISAAVAARAAAGNTILVSPGIYPEQVTINASGASGSPLVLQAPASGVVIDGADDFAVASNWTLAFGDVWLAPTVTWHPKQVFLDGTRADSSTVDPAALPARSFRWVAGAGLYVNAGGGNPGAHQARVGHRNYGLSLFGRSWITIDGLAVTRTEDRGVYLNGSCTNVTIVRDTVTLAAKMGIQIVGGSGIRVSASSIHDNYDHGIALIGGATACTIEDSECYNNARPTDRLANGIYLFNSPGNTIRRNRAHHNADTGIHVQSGSNNCIEYLNRSWSNGDHGYDHLGATGTLHIGDVAYGNYRDGFSIEGAANGTQLYDCIATDNGLTTNEFDLWVDGGSSTGFVSDYNIFWNSTQQAPIKYVAFTPYATIAAYSAASGQDTHSIQADPQFVSPPAGDFHLLAGSPAIDAANSGVPSWPEADADNQARLDDPGTTNTGIGPIDYGDRGAYEFRPANPPPVARLTISPSSGSAPLPALADGSSSSDDGTIVSYRFDFGDGTIVGPQASASASHTYAGGDWTCTLQVTDNGGLTGSTTAPIHVSANHAPDGVIGTPAGPVTIVAGQALSFTGSGTDPDHDLPLGYAWNFGGGAASSTLQNPGPVSFATAGTYTVTLTEPVVGPGLPGQPGDQPVVRDRHARLERPELHAHARRRRRGRIVLVPGEELGHIGLLRPGQPELDRPDDGRRHLSLRGGGAVRFGAWARHDPDFRVRQRHQGRPARLARCHAVPRMAAPRCRLHRLADGIGHLLHGERQSRGCS